jgi:hypothetical protein
LLRSAGEAGPAAHLRICSTFYNPQIATSKTCGILPIRIPPFFMAVPNLFGATKIAKEITEIKMKRE